MSPETSEQELLNQARLGDERAFLKIYLQHKEGVFAFAYRMLGTQEAAEDITQECFLSLVRQFDRFDQARGSLRTYLYAIARNLCHKHFRERSHEISNEGSNQEEQSDDSNPLSDLIQDERSTHVARALADLPSSQREIVILFEFEGLMLSEIASIVNIDIGAVKSRLFRARQKLKSALATYWRGVST